MRYLRRFIASVAVGTLMGLLILLLTHSDVAGVIVAFFGAILMGVCLTGPTDAPTADEYLEG